MKSTKEHLKRNLQRHRSLDLGPVDSPSTQIKSEEKSRSSSPPTETGSPKPEQTTKQEVENESAPKKRSRHASGGKKKKEGKGNGQTAAEKEKEFEQREEMNAMCSSGRWQNSQPASSRESSNSSSLLEEVLNEKKLSLLQSPEVVTWLKHQQHRVRSKQLKSTISVDTGITKATAGHSHGGSSSGAGNRRHRQTTSGKSTGSGGSSENVNLGTASGMPKDIASVRALSEERMSDMDGTTALKHGSGDAVGDTPTVSSTQPADTLGGLQQHNLLLSQPSMLSMTPEHLGLTLGQGATPYLAQGTDGYLLSTSASGSDTEESGSLSDIGSGPGGGRTSSTSIWSREASAFTSVSKTKGSSGSLSQ